MAVAGLVVFFCAALVSCSPATSNRAGHTGAPVNAATATSSPALSASPQTRTPDAPSPPYAVGFRQVSIVDRAAGTPRRGSSPPRPYRVLRTSVWYPRVAPRADRLPLIVFAHGFDVTPQTYSRLLREIAGHGYVVAAPLFPISGAGLPGPPREDDMVNQGSDLKAVVDAMTSPSARQRVPATIDPDRVAVIGHSDGAETVVGTLAIPRNRDPRVKAMVILAGQLPPWGGLPQVHAPVLVEQATGDTVNPPSLGQALFSHLARPKAYLRVLGGDHIQTVTGTGRQAATVRAAILAFLDAELSPSPTARARLRQLDGTRGTVTFVDDL